jgi:hypothetical protein
MSGLAGTDFQAMSTHRVARRRAVNAESQTLQGQPSHDLRAQRA